MKITRSMLVVLGLVLVPILVVFVGPCLWLRTALEVSKGGWVQSTEALQAARHCSYDIIPPRTLLGSRQPEPIFVLRGTGPTQSPGVTLLVQPGFTLWGQGALGLEPGGEEAADCVGLAILQGAGRGYPLKVASRPPGRER